MVMRLNENVAIKLNERIVEKVPVELEIDAKPEGQTLPFLLSIDKWQAGQPALFCPPEVL
jgi:hypothetical protein